MSLLEKAQKKKEKDFLIGLIELNKTNAHKVNLNILPFLNKLINTDV